MASRVMWAAVVVLALSASGGEARANDSSFGGQGSELLPLKETRVRMASEDIVMELKDGRWHVVATYHFENPTAEVVKLQMGFPELHCGGGGEDCVEDAGIFRDMKTTVRGREVVQRVGQVGPEQDWKPALGKVYLYDITFKPGEQVEVVHRYHHAASQSVDGPWLHYITRTGALWNGPIGRARFTVRMGWRPWGAGFSSNFTLKSYQERPVDGGGGQTEVVFEMEDWRPTRDLVIQFSNGVTDFDCPGWSFMRGYDTDKKGEEALREELRGVPRDMLRTCRNLPYAVHGYTFKDRTLNEFFYKPLKTGRGFVLYPDDEAEDGETWTRFGLRPNKLYQPSLLTTWEQRYVSMVKDEEARRQSAPSKAPAPSPKSE